MMVQRLSLITLVVPDLATERHFLEAGLGWSPVQAMDDIAFYQTGGLVLGLLSQSGWDKEKIGGPAPGPSAVAINFSTKGEVDAFIARALKAGAKLMKPAQDVYWGGYSGYFADPAGHYWEVAHNPFWTVTEDGQTLAAV